MTDHSERGRFVWHELMTPNPSGALDFYAEVVGWKAEVQGPDSSHRLFTGPAGPFGGVSPVEPTAAPKWVPFVTVDDLDEALSTAQALGADIVVEPTSTGSGGRYAVITDPQGAAIGIYSAERLEPDRPPDTGEFSWHELATTDHRAAFEFYRALFGWERITEADMGAMGVYLIFGRGGKQLGGMFDKTAGQQGEPAWLSYVRVGDLQGTIEKVERARGSLLLGPTEVPGGDSIAQVLDPYGAAFALHTLAADMKARDEDTAVVELWSAAPAASDEGRRNEIGGAEPAAPTRTRKAAKTKTSRKKAGRKKAAGATTKKTTAKKAGKKTAKKSAKKAAKKAAKKPAKKTAKKAAKKANKKAAKKANKKAAKKTTKKKTARRPTKKAKKKPAKKAGARAGKTRKKSSARSAGSKKAAKKTRKKTR